MKKPILLAMAVMLFACNSSQELPANKLYKLNDAKNDAEITITFNPQDGRMAGKAAVNRYFGTYKTNGNKITLGPVGSTMMMGPQPLMEAEQDYLQTLPKITSFSVKDDNLTLTASDGRKLVFTQVAEDQTDAAPDEADGVQEEEDETEIIEEAD